MKASELMIGDWVRTENSHYPIKVGEIRCDWVVNDADTMRIYETELIPIPLTPEILEKNGFHYTNDHTLKGADTYVLRLEQHSFDFTITIKLNDYFALDSYDDRVYRLAEIETGKWNVHQLQHALRLCGIEKEIEL